MLLRNIFHLSLVVAIQHQPEVNMGKMCPVFRSCTESFSVTDIRIIGFDPLNLFLYKLIISRRYALPLLGRPIDNPFLSYISGGWTHCNPVVAFGGGASVNPVLWVAVPGSLNILP
ncbi:hypothetical protein V8G54_017646 [Vigna mungo]|uniref:Uncharacterized protein n=1 Tax=Vigna mungo TaxID=3915 RepID=A0AAQ3NQE2_VIGMU